MIGSQRDEIPRSGSFATPDGNSASHKPRASSLTSANNNEEKTSSVANNKEGSSSMALQDNQVVGVTQFLEQQERLEISGTFINTLINNKPGKKLNLAQMQLEANENYLSVLRG